MTSAEEIDPRRRSRATRRVRVAALVTVVVVALVSLVLALRFDSDPRVVASPLIGHPVPDVELPFLEQEGSLALRELRGEVLVVNFWAPWCIPCRAEHGALASAAALGGNVRVIGVVYQASADDAKAFLARFGRAYDVVIDPGSRAAIDFGLFGVPETFFVDATGTIVAKVTGPVDEAILLDTLDEIRRGESPDSVDAGPVRTAP